MSSFRPDDICRGSWGTGRLGLDQLCQVVYGSCECGHIILGCLCLIEGCLGQLLHCQHIFLCLLLTLGISFVDALYRGGQDVDLV